MHETPTAQDSQQSWVIASNNPKKIQELQCLLGDGVKLTSLADHSIPSPEENGLTFVENALIKARVASAITGLPALADDSGLVVDALGGEPGLYSARYAFAGATDQDNNKALLQALEKAGLPFADAHYHCTLVFLRHSQDPDPLVAQGRWFGRIYPQAQGSNGFGYDPLFYVQPDFLQTAAQLPEAVKAAQSHRGIAIRELQRLLTALSDA